MRISRTVMAVMLAGMAGMSANAGTVETMYAASAGNDMSKLRQQVEEFAQLAQAEVDAKGGSSRASANCGAERTM